MGTTKLACRTALAAVIHPTLLLAQHL